MNIENIDGGKWWSLYAFNDKNPTTISFVTMVLKEVIKEKLIPYIDYCKYYYRYKCLNIFSEMLRNSISRLHFLIF